MGKLYIISTPIGNIDDLSLNTIKILKEKKNLICENIFTTKKLLTKLEISYKNKKFISYNKFNEYKKSTYIANLILNDDYVLTVNAGTPTISDPGVFLIREANKLGIEIIHFSGTSSLITALVLSGIFYKSFIFHGFISKKKNEIIKTIKNSLEITDLLIFFESPHRINKTLKIILENIGDIEIVIARELTKKFQEIIKNKVSNLLKLNLKGEIIILIPKKYERK